MPRPPRCLEVLLGLSVVACAVASFRSEIPERALVGTLQLTVGCLLLLSRPLKQTASPVQVACSLPALAAGAALVLGVLLRDVPPRGSVGKRLLGLVLVLFSHVALLALHWLIAVMYHLRRTLLT